MPVQALVAEAGTIPVAGWNHLTGRRRAAVARSKIDPARPHSRRSFEVVETHIDVVLDVVAVLGRNIGTSASQVPDGHFAEAEIHIFDTTAVPAHVERVKIVDLDVLAAV